MSWLSLHPYTAAAGAAGLLLIVGTVIVESRTAIRPVNLTVWGVAGAPLLNPSAYSPTTLLSNIPQSDGPGIVPIYIPPSQAGVEAQSDEEAAFDFDLFISAIAQPLSSSAKTTESPDLGLAYAFIPRALVATSTPTVSRTESQQRLFNYGNDAASYIQTFEDSHRNAPNTLRDQAADRQSSQKIQAVKLVASAMRSAGESLLGMEDIPDAAKAVHTALGESYIDAGKALARIPDAASDDTFIAAIEEYNAAADTLVKNYVDLAVIFTVSGVTFSSQDPGSIFTFSGGSGL